MRQDEEEYGIPNPFTRPMVKRQDEEEYGIPNLFTLLMGNKAVDNAISELDFKLATLINDRKGKGLHLSNMTDDTFGYYGVEQDAVHINKKIPSPALFNRTYGHEMSHQRQEREGHKISPDVQETMPYEERPMEIEARRAGHKYMWDMYDSDMLEKRRIKTWEKINRDNDKNTNIPVPLRTIHGTGTTLGNEEEVKFQDWYKAWANKMGMNANPDDPNHYYDYRGAYKAGVKAPSKKGEHWTSEWKDLNHPNRFVDGVDTITGKPVKKTIEKILKSNKNNPFTQMLKEKPEMVNMGQMVLDGKYVVFPLTRYKDGKMISLPPLDALDKALMDGSYIKFDNPADADMFTKKVWGK